LITWPGRLRTAGWCGWRGCRSRLGYSGRQLGDPAKAGAALLTALDSPAPPGHLLLGTDALRLVRAARAQLDGEIGTWGKLSAGTDFSDGPAPA
jgi:hypothetical protein